MGEAAVQAGCCGQQLAEMAVEETRMGIVQDKAVKNSWQQKFSEIISGHENCWGHKEDQEKKVIEIAEPVGVIAGITPTLIQLQLFSIKRSSL